MLTVESSRDQRIKKAVLTLTDSADILLITLGVMQQIIRAFYRVLDSFQFLVKSLPTIVELISVYKRLQVFSKTLK
jgi:ABC-type long-subunit fatty acid transport system fused permease/ATPase subunit